MVQALPGIVILLHPVLQITPKFSPWLLKDFESTLDDLFQQEL